MHIQCNGTPPGHRTSPGMNSSPAAHRPAEDDKLTRDRTKSTEQERSTPSGIVNDAHRDRNARQGGVHGAGVRRSSKRELELASCGSLPPFENLQARCSRLTWRVAPRASAEGRAQRGTGRFGGRGLCELRGCGEPVCGPGSLRVSAAPLTDSLRCGAFDNAGPALSASQRSLGMCTLGPRTSSPSFESWAPANQELSPLLDCMAPEHALRFVCCRAVLHGMLQLDRTDSVDGGGVLFCPYTEDGILKPQRLVARYSCLARNNACLDLSSLPDL